MQREATWAKIVEKRRSQILEKHLAFPKNGVACENESSRFFPKKHCTENLENTGKARQFECTVVYSMEVVLRFSLILPCSQKETSKLSIWCWYYETRDTGWYVKRGCCRNCNLWYKWRIQTKSRGLH